MKILVVGVGAFGGYFGGRLVQAVTARTCAAHIPK
jgi:ketopantoate reductase